MKGTLTPGLLLVTCMSMTPDTDSPPNARCSFGLVVSADTKKLGTIWYNLLLYDYNLNIKLRRSRDCIGPFVCACVRACVCVFVCVRPCLASFSSLNADKCIVNIMKVYIERNNMQVGLIIRFRKKYRLYSRLLLRSEEFNAISLTECNSKQLLSDSVYCHLSVVVPDRH